MIRGSAWGIGKGLDGKESTHLAIQEALISLGSALEVQQLLSTREIQSQWILLVADGVNGDASQVCTALKENQQPLAAGETRAGKTFQVGGAQWLGRPVYGRTTR